LSTPSLSKELATKLLTHYPAIDGQLEDYSLMPQGLFNENAKLVVGGQTLVVKKMTAGRSIERHRFGASLQKVLAENGFSCPGVMENKEGDVITAHDGNLWSIQTWANGHSCLPQWKDGPQATTIRADIGAAVGKLHALAMDAQKQNKLAPAPDDAQLALTGMLARVTTASKNLFCGSFLRPSQATRLKYSPNKSPLQKEVSAMLPALEKGCEKLASWDPGSHESLNLTSPCHGDINWENLFFQDARLSAVLDFDNAMLMSPAFDAAAAAAVVCGSNSEYSQAFFRAYQEAGGLPLDPATIPPLMLLKYVRSLLWQVSVVLSGGTGDDDLALQWMAFLSQNIEHLVND
jgi:Ser/Thr protein kinase RdoA (MazF antagonist)